jgi:hypothetical protein
VFWVRFPLRASPLRAGFDVRWDLTVASLRIIAARPVFGVGVGRYDALSPLVLSPWLAVKYGEENAHDYFLQTFAELGMAGLLALLWLLASALRPAISALRDRARDYVSTGLLAGALAYLITCMSEHPLLVREAGFPFWMVLALAIVTAGSQFSTGRPRRRIVTIGGVVACVLVFASVPFRLDIPRVRLLGSQEGFGPWQTDRDGKRFREAAEYSSLFVGADVTALEIPLRRVPGLKGHRLTVLDREPTSAMHQTPVTDSWSSVVVSLPGADPLAAYQRINLTVVDGDRPPENPRASGVAVGDVNSMAIRD